MVKQKVDLDAVFGSLSDPTRRAIVGNLTRENGQPLSKIAEPFSMSLPAVSKHVTVLEQAGIITRKKVGRNQLISLNPKSLEQSIDWLVNHQQFWNKSFDRLEKHLQGTSKNKK